MKYIIIYYQICIINNIYYCYKYSISISYKLDYILL